MRIEELDAKDSDGNDGVLGKQIVEVDGAKRALVGAGARILFYPTLLYNVLRNKIETEFRWWDEVDQVFLSRISIRSFLFLIQEKFESMLYFLIYL